MLNLKTKLTCPNPDCKKSFNYDLLKVKSGSIIICPHCKTKISIEGNPEDLTKFDKTLESLRKSVKKGF